MKTFKAYIYKEHIEAIKQSRYIILAAGILLFAILDPIMLKMMPIIIQSQANVEIPNMAIDSSMAISNYIKDLHQIGFIFVIFSFAGTLLGEIRNQRLIFPYSKGAVPSEIIFAKITHYAVTLALLTLVGLLINYFYVWYLFSEPALSLWKIIYPLVAINLYYWVFLSIALLLSSFFKKTSSVGITVLLFSYFVGVVSLIWFAGKDYLPGRLIDSAYNYTFDGTLGIFAISIITISIFIYLSTMRMSRVEVS